MKTNKTGFHPCYLLSNSCKEDVGEP